MALYPKLILDALQTVRYPATGKSIVEAEMIGDIHIDGNVVSFSIIFARATDPFRKSLIKAAEATVHRLGEDIGVPIEVHIDAVTPEPKPAGEHKQTPLQGVKNIIGVSSGKGGVGKSTIAANIAAGLAMEGKCVGLLDADIFGPSMPKMFGVEDARPYSEHIDGKDMIVPVEKYGVKLLSIGFFVDVSQPVIWRGGMASNALKQLITEAHWGELDYFIIDLPPGTSDIHLTLMQTLSLTGAIVVTTPQPVALADARKGIEMFRNEKLNVPVLGIVENMAWFTPAELPENKYYLFGRDGGKALAEELSIPLLAQIPIVQSIRENADAGTPAILRKDDPVATALRNLVKTIITTT